MIPSTFTPTLPGQMPGMTPEAGPSLSLDSLVLPQVAGKGGKDLQSGGSELDFAAILAAGQQQFQLPTQNLPETTKQINLPENAQNSMAVAGDLSAPATPAVSAQNQKLAEQLKLMSSLPGAISAMPPQQSQSLMKALEKSPELMGALKNASQGMDSLMPGDDESTLDSDLNRWGAVASEASRQSAQSTWRQGLGGAEFLGLREQAPSASAPALAQATSAPVVGAESELAKADSSKTTRTKSKSSDDTFRADALNGSAGQTQLDSQAKTHAVNPVREGAATAAAGEFAARGADRRERVGTLDQEGLKAIGMRISQTALRGGGEMKIRLNPEHLGELQVRVSTHGREVGVKFEASSEEAKNILQSSLQDLRAQLATHQLTLGDVDLSVSKFAVPVATGMDSGSETNSQQNHVSAQSSNGIGQGFVESDGKNQRDRSPSRADNDDGDWAPIRRRATPQSVAAAQFARSAGSSRRIDVQA